MWIRLCIHRSNDLIFILCSSLYTPPYDCNFAGFSCSLCDSNNSLIVFFLCNNQHSIILVWCSWWTNWRIKKKKHALSLYKQIRFHLFESITKEKWKKFQWKIWSIQPSYCWVMKFFNMSFISIEFFRIRD